MSNRILRTMYVNMVRGRAKVEGLRGQGPRVARADVACFAAGTAGLRAGDVVMGCRRDGVLEAMRPSTSLPLIADGLGRLYAAAGAAMTFAKGSERVAVAYFERHEVGGAAWMRGLGEVAGWPLVLTVLPPWKSADEVELGRAARKVGVPAIAVDAADAMAVYRVAQESMVRARMGGGAAMIEGVWFRVEGVRSRSPDDAVKGLAGYLEGRGIASAGWLRRMSIVEAAAEGKGLDAET